jgi:Flp pilus assembly pilin Flp
MKRVRSELGQTTAEYALVLLAAAAVAIVLITWARGDNGLSEFFSSILERIMAQIPG